MRVHGNSTTGVVIGITISAFWGVPWYYLPVTAFGAGLSVLVIIYGPLVRQSFTTGLNDPNWGN